MEKNTRIDMKYSIAVDRQINVGYKMLAWTSMTEYTHFTPLQDIDAEYTLVLTYFHLNQISPLHSDFLLRSETSD